MPNLKWNELSHLQLGRYAEYLVKMEFASHGFEIYTPEVDDHGVDFIARIAPKSFIEIQVKSLRADNKGNYTYISKEKMDASSKNRYVSFIHFTNGEIPAIYLIPATAWQKPNSALVDRNYDKPGQESPPEWGINFSKKNRNLLEKYLFDNRIGKLK